MPFDPHLKYVYVGRDPRDVCMSMWKHHRNFTAKMTTLMNTLPGRIGAAYNILCRDGGIVVIDFPQAVDARFNPNARQLLERDLENICGHFARGGLQPDPRRIANEIGRRYRVSEL